MTPRSRPAHRVEARKPINRLLDPHARRFYLSLSRACPYASPRYVHPLPLSRRGQRGTPWHPASIAPGARSPLARMRPDFGAAVSALVYSTITERCDVDADGASFPHHRVLLDG